MYVSCFLHNVHADFIKYFFHLYSHLKKMLLAYTEEVKNNSVPPHQIIFPPLFIADVIQLMEPWSKQMNLSSNDEVLGKVWSFSS